jgi:HK97 gp10 family phage protein
MSIELTGLQQLIQRLYQLQNPKPIEEKALQQGAEYLRDRMKENVPIRTGNLKENVVVGVIKNESIEVGVKKSKKAFYGGFVEFGTTKITPRPFMRPTFERETEQIKRIFAKEIRRGLGL